MRCMEMIKKGGGKNWNGLDGETIIHQNNEKKTRDVHNMREEIIHTEG